MGLEAHPASPQLLGSLAGPSHCLTWVSLPARQLLEEFLLLTSAKPEPLDLHGYEAGHGGLKTVKDVAGGERHEVVHEGCQGEDERESLILGFAVWRKEKFSEAQGAWAKLPSSQPLRSPGYMGKLPSSQPPGSWAPVQAPLHLGQLVW